MQITQAAGVCVLVRKRGGARRWGEERERESDRERERVIERERERERESNAKDNTTWKLNIITQSHVHVCQLKIGKVPN